MEPVIWTAKLPQATRRRSALAGINQPTSVRPAIAAIVAALIAMPANCGPTAGMSSENRCASRPICANRPSAVPAASVINPRFRQRLVPESDLAAADARKTAAIAGSSPSGASPICCGVLEK